MSCNKSYKGNDDYFLRIHWIKKYFRYNTAGIKFNAARRSNSVLGGNNDINQTIIFGPLYNSQKYGKRIQLQIIYNSLISCIMSITACRYWLTFTRWSNFRSKNNLTWGPAFIAISALRISEDSPSVESKHDPLVIGIN